MRRVMWEWTVRSLDFVDQVAATAAGRFDVLTLSFRKVREFTANGRTVEDLAAIAADQGVALDYFDGLSSWAPIRYPEGDDFLREAFDFTPGAAFELCRRSGMSHILAVAGFAKDQLPFDLLVESFARFCDMAADHGIWVDLEPIPMLGLPTLAEVWAVVRDADRANSGILFDTWHFMRGGADWDLLKSIPHGRIRNVQLVDGFAVSPDGNLWEDAMHHREFAGRGVLPIDRMLAILRDTQTLDSIGPEALSDRVDALGATALGREAAETLDRALASSGLRPARTVV